MGTKRKESDSKLKLRLTQATKDRDTLVPCEACQASGYRLIERVDGTYRQVSCKWCDGGLATPMLAIMFRRWQAILKHNLDAGLCGHH